MSELRSSFGSTRALVALLAFLLGFATVPHRVCERDAIRWFDGDPRRTDALANGVARWTEREIDPAGFHTGSSRFDGEWLFVTQAMAAIGFGQLALDREETRAENLARMEHSLDVLLDPRLRGFDRAMWNEDALDAHRGHLGALGYLALPFALHERLAPGSRFAAHEHALVAAIEERFARGGLVETYPDLVYPPDNAAALAALAVHGRSPALAQGLGAIRHAVDPATGLLLQVLGGRPRASGTALAAYFLAYADPVLSKQLFRALERHQFRTVLGFGGMLEEPGGPRLARGEKMPPSAPSDAGPVVLGFGVAATGFAIGAARAHRARDTFTALCATAHLFGGPLDEDVTTLAGTRASVRTYALGGPLGDAFLFAMLTAPQAGRFVP